VTEHILSKDCPCGPTVEYVPPTPTAAQMRAYLRANRPDLEVGRRGFLSTDAVAAYREAHGLS
jgi:hypothetical protein